MKLTKSQIAFMLNSWFTAYDLIKIFDAYDVAWLTEQEFELKNCRCGWPDVYMNGKMKTSINCSSDRGKELFSKLLHA